MGLLDGLGGKGKKDKAPKAQKKVKAPAKVKGNKGKGGKKPMFGGKKKEMTLIERMQLEESVAAASLDVVQDLANEGNAAVREVEDGLLIVVFNNESLGASGLDPASEEFGSFAEALRSETVESIALADDLANGVIGIIPSQETLLSLDEFDFVQDLEFQWAIVPFDLDDSDRLIVLDDTVSIGRLVELANDNSIKLTVRNGVVSADDEVSDDDVDFPEEEEDEFADETPDDDFDDEPATDYPEDDEDDFDDEPSDDSFDDDFDEPADTYAPIPQDDGFDDDDDFGSDDDDFDDDADGAFNFDSDDNADESYADDEELMSVEESKEAINRVVQHSFNNTELDLSIDMSKFDDYFDSVTLAQFDTKRVDNSELQNVISRLRQDANTELARFHQDNIQSLRNKFTTSMRDIHNRLVESLDHKDADTTYGERYYQIDAAFNEAMDDIDRQISSEINKLTSQYREAREEYGENAKREAFAVYDTRYKSELDRKTAAVRVTVPADIKNNRDSELGELYEDRRTIAQRLFDKATTALLQTLQAEHQNIAQKELRMYDVFRKEMDVYLRRHFADEVLRAKAEAEKLRQSHEAERVRQEYEQMLLTKAQQLKEADTDARNAVNQLEAAHREQLNQVKADYDRRVEREQKDNEDLRKLLNDANESTAKIAEQKDREVAHQMKVLKDQIKGQEKELEYANARNARTQKPVYMMMIAAALIALALGVIAGFLTGANSTEYAPGVSQNEQNSDSVSYLAPSDVGFDEQYELTIDYQETA